MYVCMYVVIHDVVTVPVRLLVFDMKKLASLWAALVCMSNNPLAVSTDCKQQIRSSD